MRCASLYGSYATRERAASESCIASSRLRSCISIAYLLMSCSASKSWLTVASFGTSRTRAANWSVEMVSSMCVSSPYTFAISSVLQLPPRESLSRCVSFDCR